MTIIAAGKTLCQRGMGRHDETISEAESAEEDASVGDGERTEATRNVFLTLTPRKGVDPRSADFSIYAKVEDFAGLTSTSSTIDVVVEP